MESNIDIIKALYTHFANRNMDAIKDLFAQNIEWTQMKGFPNGGFHIGFDAIVQNVFQGFSENWTNWKAEVHEYSDAGNSVFVTGQYKGTYNQTNKYTEADFVHRYVLESGKITHFFQYTDTLMVAEAMQ